MVIKEEPLTESERKKLKFILKARLVLGLIISPFIILIFVFMGAIIIDDMSSHTAGGSTYFAVGFTAIVVFLILRFVIPFYKNSFKNLKIDHKLVVYTTVLSVDQRWTSKGYKYSIETEYRSIDSWSITTVMQPSLPFSEMRANMAITIHCLKDNPTDILYIEKTN
ncbi:hypothetical protein [Pedobacter nototheniae]|uniref:hypothetical protein n=1 Tax=Pedobacter nototheniae TaxID=2488994 RepID=UPI00292D54AC|nr:hypothetical protein [Pedobacter nototheniae]